MNGIDFLKSCATNIQTIEGIGKMHWAKYLENSNSPSPNKLHDAMLDLRASNILCAKTTDELWTFSATIPEFSQILGEKQHQFVVGQSGNVEDELARPTGNERALRDLLLEAIEGSMSFCFGEVGDVLHVGSWEWMAMHPTAENWLLTMHASLSDDGRLFMAIASRPSMFRAYDAENDGEVLLAPSGKFAKVVAAPEIEPAIPSAIVQGDMWRERVTRALRPEGIDIKEGETWVEVELGPALRLIWPSGLCLAFKHHSKFVTTNAPAQNDWGDWFRTSASYDESFKDPLAVANSWFIEASDRFKPPAVTELENNVDEQALASMDNTTHEEENVGDSIATSPPFSQRLVDQHAAAAGIYPTPPDGFVPSQTAVLQQLSDSAQEPSVPGDQTSPLQEPMATEISGPDARNSIGSSVGLPNFQSGDDDLFGDMGEISFGTNDIDDADFDYFDDPNAVPLVDGDKIASGPAVTHTQAAGDEENGNLEIPVDNTATNSFVSSSTVGGAHGLDDDGFTSGPFEMQGQEFLRIADRREIDETTTCAELNPSASPIILEPAQPLSPFGIRERLLPPPVPASAVVPDSTKDAHRRSSAFAPVVFNQALNLHDKYFATQATLAQLPPSKENAKTDEPDIGLPPVRKKPRLYGKSADQIAVEESDSEDDSFHSSEPSSEEAYVPPQLPWQTGTGKRKWEDQPQIPPEFLDEGRDEEVEGTRAHQVSTEGIEELLGLLLSRESFKGCSERRSAPADNRDDEKVTPDTPTIEQSPPVNEMLKLNKLDMVYVAQLVNEQATSLTASLTHEIYQELNRLHIGNCYDQSSTQEVANKALENIASEIEPCDLTNLALVREQPRPPVTAAGKPAQPGQPRPPPQRAETSPPGPDYFQIQLPHVRVQRGSDTYEMLPPALDFWTALNLGPTNGQKDVQGFCVLPSNESLVDLTQDFLTELGHAYDGCKLGSFGRPTGTSKGLDLDGYPHDLAMVELTENPSVVTAIETYAQVCVQLGKSLAGMESQDPDRAIVIYFVDPFNHAKARQALCACFWKLCKSYRSNARKESKSKPKSDLILQILPINLIASRDGLVILDAHQMCALAKETYDRSPPSQQFLASANAPMALQSLLTSQAVELANPPPKRIGFQLTADPPKDLMHEGSILHLAYAVSADGQWMSFCWTEGTGKYAQNLSVCLRGRTFADVTEDVWDQTLAIMTAREVTWRIFIVSPGDADRHMIDHWRELVARAPRKQTLHVTMLTVSTDPELELTAPPPEDQGIIPIAPNQSASGFLTPGSTPQGTNMTVSPDANGQSALTAPPTPAPSDAAPNPAENDPDAYLVDLADEAWGLLLAPSYANATPSRPRSGWTPKPLASALLLRRGTADVLSTNATSRGKLDGLGVSLYWDIRIRPSGQVDEGPTRQAEVTMREVLRMYRNLSLLARVRGVGVEGCGVVPLHVVCVMKGAEALEGLA